MKEKYSPEEAQLVEELTGQPVESEQLEKPPYEKIKTKVWKKRFAPQGSLFYGVRFKKDRRTYTNVILMKCEGKDEKGEMLLWEHLWSQLKAKYKL